MGEFVSFLQEAAKKPTAQQLHRGVMNHLERHGLKREDYENQSGSHVSWFKGSKPLDVETRATLAKRMGLHEHPHAQALGYGPAQHFVSHHHELNFSSNGISGTLRTHKTAESRAGWEK